MFNTILTLNLKISFLCLDPLLFAYDDCAAFLPRHSWRCDCWLNVPGTDDDRNDSDGDCCSSSKMRTLIIRLCSSVKVQKVYQVDLFSSLTFFSSSPAMSPGFRYSSWV